MMFFGHILLILLLSCLSSCSTSLSATKGRDKNASGLLHWLRADNATIINLEVKNDGSGNLAMAAMRDFTQGEVVLKISKHCLITADIVAGKKREKEDLSSQMLARNIGASEVKHLQLLYAVLCDMQNQSSIFQPYYAMLPSALPLLPIFWHPVDVQRLGPGETKQNKGYNTPSTHPTTLHYTQPTSI